MKPDVNHSKLLPDEILIMVFSLLPLQDIKSLRLSSHALHNCSSQFLLWSLNIDSSNSSLTFNKAITSDDLFRKGISKITYNTRLRASTPSGELINVEDVRLLRLEPDAFDQSYSVYDLLCYGIPRLPMLREIIITDRILVPDPSTTEPGTISPEATQRITRNGELGLFILLRALATVRARPRIFRINLKSCIGGTTLFQPLYSSQKNENNTYGAGYGSDDSPSLFDRCITSAFPIFQDLHHFSIVTEALDLSTGIESSSSFIRNIYDLIATSGPNLSTLSISIQEISSPGARIDSLLLSERIFNLVPNNFKFLKRLMLKSVPMEGFALIAFLSRAEKLEEMRLVDVRLTRASPCWTNVVDDLCLVLGVQFDARVRGRSRDEGEGRRGDGVAGLGMTPMERIKLELENVFEPSDVNLERGVSIGSAELRGCFAGKEDNPLRSCYENFVGRAAAPPDGEPSNNGW